MSFEHPHIYAINTEPLLSFELVTVQGRIADRSPGAIRGAALAAEAIGRQTGLEPKVIGTPSAHAIDDWTKSLPQALETLKTLQDTVSEIFERGITPLIVANTCSASLATLSVVAQMRPDVVILWIDAHGDFNTPETTTSGYLGGMVLAAACDKWKSGLGGGIDPNRVIIAGARDIDPPEAEQLREAGVRFLSPSQTRPETILEMIGTAPVWIHIDWDVLEPGFVPAAYAVSGGLTPDDVRAILEVIPANRIAGVELAEFEASDKDAENLSSLAHLMRIVSPILSAR